MLYNIRKFHYEDGIQIRLYQRPIKIGKGKEGDICDFSEDNSAEDIKSDLPSGRKFVISETSEDNKDLQRSLYVSMNRSKQMIYGIARANKWDYFLTLTFDRNLVDSSDYKLVVKKAQNWLDNIRKRTSPDIKYLIVPELHADMEHWHLHGLLADCPELTLTDSGYKSKSGLVIYNLQNWRYGFSTVTHVTHNHKVSAYVSKYITKELADCTKGRQRYWASNNCIRPLQVCEYDMEKLSLDEMLEKYSAHANHISERSSKDGHQKIIYIELDTE